jgi:hypothetical protein
VFLSQVADGSYQSELTNGYKVPIVMRVNWTGASGYLQMFVMAVVLAILSCT